MATNIQYNYRKVKININPEVLLGNATASWNVYIDRDFNWPIGEVILFNNGVCAAESRYRGRGGFDTVKQAAKHIADCYLRLKAWDE